MYLIELLKIYTLSNFFSFISFDNLKNPETPSLEESKFIISSKNFSNLNNSDDLEVIFQI